MAQATKPKAADKPKANGKGDTRRPAAPPERTAEEQALVNAQYKRPRLQLPPKVEVTAKGTLTIEAGGDAALWLARLSKAFGVIDADLAASLFDQVTRCVEIIWRRGWQHAFSERRHSCH